MADDSELGGVSASLERFCFVGNMDELNSADEDDGGGDDQGEGEEEEAIFLMIEDNEVENEFSQESPPVTNICSSSSPIHPPPPRNKNCFIYTVPHNIRDLDKDAYAPKVATIGPYHHDATSPLYHEMEDCKLSCLDALISRGHHDKEARAFAFTRRMHQSMDRIKSYYSHPILHDAVQLVDMMLLDGSLILSLLLRLPRRPVPGRPWIWSLVKYDLLLLENQIPFFVLDELQEILGVPGDTGVDLVGSALDLFKDVQPPMTKGFSASTSPRPHHLLHLFYLSRLPNILPLLPLSTAQSSPSPSPMAPSLSSSSSLWIPSAYELAEYGLKICKNDHSNSFLDVNFAPERRAIEIPPLLLDDHSNSLLRNLIAFEQCHAGTGCHVTAYARFMECIISSNRDARLVNLSGALVNRMGADQDVTKFFSRLCTGAHISGDRFYLTSLFEGVTRYQEDRWNKCRAEFMSTYCGNSWAVFAVVVSVVIFILTVIQTVYSIISTYKS